MLGHPQVAWEVDSSNDRVSWVALHVRLLLAGIVLIVGSAENLPVAPVIAGMIHFSANSLAGDEGMLGLHVVGVASQAMAALGDALVWITTQPVMVILGVLSHAGLVIHVANRFGLQH